MNTDEFNAECGMRNAELIDANYTNWHELILPRKNAENARRRRRN